METTYLDNEIILLEGYKKEGTATPYQLRKLKEYLKIKQVIIANVVGRSEQFKCHSCGTTHTGKNDDQLYEVCKNCFDGI